MPAEGGLAATARPLDRIGEAFARRRGRAALMPYLMGGFPTVEESLAIGLACADAGADLVELGIPFSDPLADGPVIHAAATRALASGATPDVILGVCAELSKRLPVVLMVYANIVLAEGGGEEFARRAAAAGAAGLIIPDLPHDEAGSVRDAARRHGLALVPLVAPTTSPERLAEIGREAAGFVYTVSLTGTTGERSELPPELADTVGRVRATTDVPVAVGFGISTPEQARAVAEHADGVIVGSRLVRAAGEGGAAAVEDLVRGLAEALLGSSG